MVSARRGTERLFTPGHVGCGALVYDFSVVCLYVSVSISVSVSVSIFLVGRWRREIGRTPSPHPPRHATRQRKGRVRGPRRPPAIHFWRSTLATHKGDPRPIWRPPCPPTPRSCRLPAGVRFYKICNICHYLCFFNVCSLGGYMIPHHVRMLERSVVMWRDDGRHVNVKMVTGRRIDRQDGAL